MSRIFDALQRSQGDEPQPKPAMPVQPVTPEILTATAEPSAIDAPAPHVAVPGTVVAHSNGDWLSVPPERVLHPQPTPEQRLITLTNHNSQGAEMFRVLSTRLAHMKDKRQLSRLLVSSAVGDEGKSVIAVNLAIALSQRPGERVLLMEADLRRPTAGALLSPGKQTVGLTEWHEGKIAIQDALYQIGNRPLWFLSAGKGLNEPLPILESLEFANLLETISSHFDWVVLDCTPMLPMADAASLARLCDGVLVVVREGHTRRKVLNKALESIDRKKLLGVVFNEAASQQMSYDRYYGSYGYYGGKNSNGATSDEDKGKAATA
jgi:capsular exopolysaccharide synthesis family protein